jgi:mRNA interferase RelE/StbE
VKLEFRASFAKDLGKLSDKALQARIAKCIVDAEKASCLDELTEVKKLRGGENHYRIRVGDYRIGLQVRGETLMIIRCLHRKDIYRFFP